MIDKHFFIFLLVAFVFMVFFGFIANLDKNTQDLIGWGITGIFIFLIMYVPYLQITKEKRYTKSLRKTIRNFLQPFLDKKLITKSENFETLFKFLDLDEEIKIKDFDGNDYKISIFYSDIDRVKIIEKLFKKPTKEFEERKRIAIKSLNELKRLYYSEKIMLKTLEKYYEKFEELGSNGIQFDKIKIDFPKGMLDEHKELLEEHLSEIHQITLRKWAMNNSPLYNYYNAEDGGETTFYYLKLKNKFGEIRYKFGVTLSSVTERYANKHHDEFEILFEKKLTHARTIETQIKRDFAHLITDESLIGTNGTEIVKEDILKMDINKKD